MSQRDLSYLLDILSAAKLAIQFTQTIDKETFNKDDLIQSGVMRQIEIMGEATKRLSHGNEGQVSRDTLAENSRYARHSHSCL